MSDERKTTQTSSPWRIPFIICIDLAILAELCIAMRQAAMTPDSLTPVFIKTYFAMLLPTLALVFVAKRLMRPKPERSVA
jgi:hypothetical protein